MTKKTSVVLSSGWPGSFHRTMRDQQGNTVNDEAGNPRVLTFTPGAPVELTADELESVRDDVGKALHFAKLDSGKPSPKLDREATDKFVKETAELRERQKADKPEKPAAPAKEFKPAPLAQHKSDFEKKDK